MHLWVLAACRLIKTARCMSEDYRLCTETKPKHVWVPNLAGNATGRVGYSFSRRALWSCNPGRVSYATQLHPYHRNALSNWRHTEIIDQKLR